MLGAVLEDSPVYIVGAILEDSYASISEVIVGDRLESMLEAILEDSCALCSWKVVLEDSPTFCCGEFYFMFPYWQQ